MKIKNRLMEDKLSNDTEKLLLGNIKPIDMIAGLIVRPIILGEYPIADNFLERHLYHGRRPRSYEFLLEKLRENPKLFLGLYLGDELIGVIEGFPREDYLLLSEIAVDMRFRSRGFGTLLIRYFEEEAKKSGYDKIKLGAEDNAVKLYLNNNYIPSLFLQVYDAVADEILDGLKGTDMPIINVSKHDGMTGIELKIEKMDMSQLKSLKEIFNPVSIQYLFTKIL
jgi:GNAT superfamily N-acetyltransferase